MEGVAWDVVGSWLDRAEKKPTKLLRDGMRNCCMIELLSEGVGLVWKTRGMVTEGGGTGVLDDSQR